MFYPGVIHSSNWETLSERRGFFIDWQKAKITLAVKKRPDLERKLDKTELLEILTAAECFLEARRKSPANIRPFLSWQITLPVQRTYQSWLLAFITSIELQIEAAYEQVLKLEEQLRDHESKLSLSPDLNKIYLWEDGNLRYSEKLLSIESNGKVSCTLPPGREVIDLPAFPSLVINPLLDGNNWDRYLLSKIELDQNYCENEITFNEFVSRFETNNDNEHIVMTSSNTERGSPTLAWLNQSPTLAGIFLNGVYPSGTITNDHNFSENSQSAILCSLLDYTDFQRVGNRPFPGFRLNWNTGNSASETCHVEIDLHHHPLIEQLQADMAKLPVAFDRLQLGSLKPIIDLRKFIKEIGKRFSLDMTWRISRSDKIEQLRIQLFGNQYGNILTNLTQIAGEFDVFAGLDTNYIKRYFHQLFLRVFHLTYKSFDLQPEPKPNINIQFHDFNQDDFLNLVDQWFNDHCANLNTDPPDKEIPEGSYPALFQGMARPIIEQYRAIGEVVLSGFENLKKGKSRLLLEVKKVRFLVYPQEFCYLKNHLRSIQYQLRHCNPQETDTRFNPIENLLEDGFCDFNIKFPDLEKQDHKRCTIDFDQWFKELERATEEEIRVIDNLPGDSQVDEPDDDLDIEEESEEPTNQVAVGGHKFLRIELEDHSPILVRENSKRFVIVRNGEQATVKERRAHEIRAGDLLVTYLPYPGDQRSVYLQMIGEDRELELKRCRQIFRSAVRKWLDILNNNLTKASELLNEETIQHGGQIINLGRGEQAIQNWKDGDTVCPNSHRETFQFIGNQISGTPEGGRLLQELNRVSETLGAYAGHQLQAAYQVARETEQNATQSFPWYELPESGSIERRGEVVLRFSRVFDIEDYRVEG